MSGKYAYGYRLIEVTYTSQVVAIGNRVRHNNSAMSSVSDAVGYFKFSQCNEVIWSAQFKFVHFSSLTIRDIFKTFSFKFKMLSSLSLPLLLPYRMQSHFLCQSLELWSKLYLNWHIYNVIKNLFCGWKFANVLQSALQMQICKARWDAHSVKLWANDDVLRVRFFVWEYFKFPLFNRIQGWIHRAQ